MNFLTPIQEGKAKERPELVPSKVCQEKAKREGLVFGGVAAILSVTSMISGYVISRSSFNNCLLDVQLKQQRKETAAKSESSPGDVDSVFSDITANQELKLQSKESVFVDPYNTTESDNYKRNDP
ncbi:13081_t:CDS:2 [Funneliformis mosseae]|uniref:13081_t:CDS:1 n=1 Tax=Funneliformis mosseae TaxID=27381 RepID=A0A9N9B6W9_FUNMO|nr:13081_t:CDS:2 [Funneliformis mosseae]